MKKYLCLLLAGVLLLSLTACRKEDEAAGTQPQTEATQATTQPTAPANTKTQPGSHTFTLTTAADNPAAKILTVTDKVTKREIQTIRLSGNEWFVPEPIYTDITFDGNRDILVPAQRSASGVFFAGYIWVEQMGQYVHAPKLADSPNLALDPENKLLLSHRTQSQITSYSMCRYNVDTQDFEVIRTLCWEPCAGGVAVMEEAYTDGETKINQFIVPTADGLHFPEKDSANMAPYYAAGSVWDLDSDKWRNWLYTP